MPPAIRAKAEAMGVPLLAAVPYDPLLVEFDGAGAPLVELPEETPISRAVAAVARELVNT